MMLARTPSPTQPAAPVAVLASGAELGDDELEQVVGGLERIYLPGLPIAST
jgi:hypothetical protein